MKNLKVEWPKELFVIKYSGIHKLDFVKQYRKDDPHYGLYVNKCIFEPVWVFYDVKVTPHEFIHERKTCYLTAKEAWQTLKEQVEHELKHINNQLKRITNGNGMD